VRRHSFGGISSRGNIYLWGERKKYLWREHTLFSIIDKEQRQATQVSANIDDYVSRNNASAFTYAIINGTTCFFLVLPPSIDVKFSPKMHHWLLDSPYKDQRYTTSHCWEN
jgi:hypothetical protein